RGDLGDRPSLHRSGPCPRDRHWASRPGGISPAHRLLWRRDSPGHIISRRLSPESLSLIPAMQLCRRQLAFGETDHELIWLSVSVASLGLAATWLSLGLPWPQCAFHTITGHPCATCGMTRSAIQFFHGHFFAALRWN